jgi:hypothetical protein
MRARRLVDLFFVVVLAVSAAGTFPAQQLNKPPAAPIPTPIFTGKKVCNSNAAGGPVDTLKKLAVPPPILPANPVN